MPPSETSQVSEEEWICRFIPVGEWDDEHKRPFPGAFLASARELSLFHPNKVAELGSELRDLCFDNLEGAGEAHLQVKTCIELGQGISPVFHPKVYWRPDKVHKLWKRWKDAHVHIESEAGNSGFPRSYRALLAENATCLRLPDGS